MKALIYDTETTGIPEWKLPSTDPAQPYLVELCAQLVGEDDKTILDLDMIVKPEGWTVSPELVEIHGITTEQALEEGKPISEVLDAFHYLCKQADVQVGHNVNFDTRILRIALLREGRTDEAESLKGMPKFCTMFKAAPIMKAAPEGEKAAAGYTGNKTPSLAEAYKFFTGKDLGDAHTARQDVAAAREVYFALQAIASQEPPPPPAKPAAVAVKKAIREPEDLDII